MLGGGFRDGVFPVGGWLSVVGSLIFVGVVNHEAFGGEDGVFSQVTFDDDADVLSEHLGGDFGGVHGDAGFFRGSFTVTNAERQGTLGFIPLDGASLYHPPQAYGGADGHAAFGQHFTGCPIINEVLAYAALCDENERARGNGQGARGEEFVFELRRHRGIPISLRD